MHRIIVADVPTQDYGRFVDFGISRFESTSWAKAERSPSGFLRLLSEAGCDCDAAAQVTDIVLAPFAEATSLEEYFLNLRSRFGPDADDLTSDCTSSSVFIFNLMPFSLTRSRMDKIVRGIFSEDNRPLIRAFNRVVFLMRNIDGLFLSDGFRRVRESGTLSCETLAIDIRGYGISCTPDGVGRNFSISREAFAELLNVSEKRVYHSLIWETNSHLGHFQLPHAHVRTHYNLVDFMKRDNVWEYIYGKLAALISNASRVLLVGTGIEVDAIARLGYRLESALLEDHASVEFLHSPSSDPADIVPSNWTGDYDAAVVLGDIVCTGGTLDSWIKELQRTNSRGVTIGALSIVSMKNSPTAIRGVPLHSGVRIRRVFFPSNRAKCNLCQVGQPYIRVRNYDDFHSVHTSQLTPYDFWELVSDSHALLTGVPDSQGRLFSYRVDTLKIVKRYGQWLRNVISEKFKQHWPRTPVDVICTVDEESGSAFAALVKEAIHAAAVVSIHRSTLRRLTSSGGLPEGTVNPLRQGQRVLVVDDGMNYGRTMSQLVQFCRLAGCIPFGGIVFDSRLTDTELRKLQAKAGGCEIVALYRWPIETRTL